MVVDPFEPFRRDINRLTKAARAAQDELLLSLDVNKKLGTRVRQLRTERRWSQEELADRAQLHRTYIGGIERGERNVSLHNIVRIATALGVPPWALLFDIGRR